MNSNGIRSMFIFFFSLRDITLNNICTCRKILSKIHVDLSFDECRMQRNDFRKMKRICREINKKKKETCYLIRVVINVNVQFKTTIY